MTGPNLETVNYRYKPLYEPLYEPLYKPLPQRSLRRNVIRPAKRMRKLHEAQSRQRFNIQSAIINLFNEFGNDKKKLTTLADIKFMVRFSMLKQYKSEQDAINEVREWLTIIQEDAFKIEKELNEGYGLPKEYIEKRVQWLMEDPDYNEVNNRWMALKFTISRENLNWRSSIRENSEKSINDVRECLTKIQDYASDEIEKDLEKVFGLRLYDINQRVQWLIDDPDFEKVDNRRTALEYILSQELYNWEHSERSSRQPKLLI